MIHKFDEHVNWVCATDPQAPMFTWQGEREIVVRFAGIRFDTIELPEFPVFVGKGKKRRLFTLEEKLVACRKVIAEWCEKVAKNAKKHGAPKPGEEPSRIITPEKPRLVLPEDLAGKS